MMKKLFRLAPFALIIAATPASARGLEAAAAARPAPMGVSVATARYRGRLALHSVDLPGDPDGCCLIPLDIRDFRDGTIEAWVAGRPRDGAGETARGFIGLAFRVQEDGRYEAFYIRPTNSRADDQLRRNRSLQYIAEPDFPWERLRRETPGGYEAYADLETGGWTHLRIEIDGLRARLYVNRAAQPSLIVNDLRLGGEMSGGVALWVGPETDGHFADVRVTPRR